MKKKNTLIKIVTVFTAFAIGGSLLSNHFAKYKELDATQYIGDYDPYTYSGSYYNGFDFDAAGGMNGTLRTALTAKIKPQAFYTYSAGLSAQLQGADEDPTNSSNMVTFYTRNSITKTAGTVNGNVIWTREHVWPQSLSNENWGEEEGGVDLLHLRPEYQSPNSTRGNHPFGETTNSNSDKKTYNDMTYGWLSGGYFEPLDCVKGDVARIIMYTWVTYTGWPGYNSLDIKDVFQSYDTLLTWHTQDKPDMLEGKRNDYAYASNQKNRNPFVDHPELAWKIFSDAPNLSTSVKNACMAAYPESGTSDVTTLTFDVATYATANNVASGTKVSSIAVDDVVTLSATGTDANTGKIYIGNAYTEWRFYTSGSGTLNINVADGYELVSASGQIGSSNFGAPSNVDFTISSNKVAYNPSSNFNVKSLSITYKKASATPVEPTSVTITNKPSSNFEIDDTLQLNAVIEPSNAVATISWKSNNTSAVTVTDSGFITAKGAGFATITAYIDANSNNSPDTTETKDTCVITVNEPVVVTTPLSEVINLSYTSLTGTGGSAITNEQAVSKVACNNSHITAVKVSSIYDGNGNGGAYPSTAGFLKTGTSSAAGQIKFTLDGLANKVEILCHDFYKPSEQYPTNSNTFSVNGSDTQLAPYNTEATFDTLTFELDEASNVITIDINNRAFIKSIRISYIDPNIVPTADTYLNNASLATILEATDNTSQATTASVTFSQLGLENSIQYTDPFSLDENISVTFAGGTDDGKYYTTGSGIRTYGNGTITVASTTDNITKIVFTWSGSYKPDSASVASVGTYAIDTGTWTGSAKSITLTRPSGSGHWRLQSVVVTYGGDVSLSAVSLQFGATIAKVDWDNIEAEYGIQDYGVMIFRTTVEYIDVVPTVENYYRGGNTVAIFNRGSNVAPTNEDGYYTFTARVRITSPNNYGLVFCAASFIVTGDGEYHFFCETKKSVNMLASEYISSGYNGLSNAALNVLAGLN